jgi:hypothetical protein
MRNLLIAVMLTGLTVTQGSSGRFVVEGTTGASSTVVVTVEPRSGAPGYAWLRVYFYPAPLTPPDKTAAEQGRIAAIKAKWNGVLQVTVANSTIWQIDLSVPGHTCTIADSDRDARKLVTTFQFVNRHLRLVSRGSHVCDMKSLGIPNQTFTWDVDVDAAVIDASKEAL